VERRGQPHGDHVLRDGVAKADAGIEALRDDVGQAVIGRDLDGDLRVPPRHLDQQGRHGDGQRGARGVQAQGARDAALVGAQALGRVLDFRQRRPDAGDEGRARLGQPHAARRAREQGLAEAGLDELHRVADGGCAHSQLAGGGRETATPMHRRHNGKVREQRPVHS